nr:protein STRUBBELIG-receptor family 8 [Tanacetum cinerariifolium]
MMHNSSNKKLKQQKVKPKMDGLALPGASKGVSKRPVGLSTCWPGGASTHESGGAFIREPGGPSTHELGGLETRALGETRKSCLNKKNLVFEVDNYSGRIVGDDSQRKLPKEDVDVSENNIHDALPYQLPPNLTSLNLANNKLNGNIPYSIALMYNLNYMNLSRNVIAQNIGDIFNNLTGLTTLDLSNNNLTGDLPNSLSSLSNISTFHVQNNHLTGTLNSLAGLPLNDVNIANNRFSGWIPKELLFVPTFVYDGNLFDNGPAPPPPPFTPPPPGKRNEHVTRPSIVNPPFSGEKVNAKMQEQRVIPTASIVDLKLPPTENSTFERGKSGSTKRVKSPITTSSYTVATLQTATNSFSQDNIIGEGSLGRVYRAVFPNAKIMAVKKIDNAALSLQEEDNFVEAVSNMSRLRHPNMVLLAGYCAEHGQRLLVYEYIANGSLQDLLHFIDDRSKTLTWNAHVRVALGTARALDAPEFALSGIYTVKSDVYSFGVVMLELLTGWKPLDSNKKLKQQKVKPKMDRLALPGTGEPGGQGTHGPVGLSTCWPGGASTHKSGGAFIREPGGPSTHELGGLGTCRPGGLSSRDLLNPAINHGEEDDQEDTHEIDDAQTETDTSDDELEDNIGSTSHGKTITRKETRAVGETRKSYLNKKNLVFETGPDRTEIDLVQNDGPRTGLKWYGPVRVDLRSGPTRHNLRVFGKTGSDRTGPKNELVQNSGPKYIREGITQFGDYQLGDVWVPRESLLFVITSFSGVVSWEGDGALFEESNQDINYQ